MPDLTPINQTSASNNIDADTIPGDFTEEDLIKVEMAGAGILQQNLELQKDEIQKKNDHLKALQEALQAVDAQSPADASQDNGGQIVLTPAQYDALMHTDAANAISGASVSPLDGSFVVTWGAGGASKMANALKDEISAESNDSQMDMINLQSTLNNYNQKIETITNMVQKRADTEDKIVGNLR